MRWINTEVGTVRANEFADSSVAARGTWFSVLAWCIEQENTGLIAGAGRWSDRQWIARCGVTLREVRAAKRLLLWQGEDLAVLFYPVEKEEEVRAKRLAGQAGGKASGQARAKQSGSTASSSAVDPASTEGNGRERNGREDGSKRSPSAPDSTPPSAPVPGTSDSGPKKKGGPRIELVDEAYLVELRPLFQPGEVDRAHMRMLAWLKCPKGRNKAPTKTRFQTFLRDAEPLVSPENSRKKEGAPALVAPADWVARYELVMGEKPPEGVEFERLPDHTQQAILQTHTIQKP